MQHLIYQGIAIGVMIFFILVPTKGLAESAESAQRKVTFREYLGAVEKHSLDFESQRENVMSAKAGVSIAGVRPDPQLTFGIASKELSAANKASASTATTMGLAVTMETAGKRGKRIRAAESNVKLTEAGVASFLHQLSLESASTFVEACRTRDALTRKQSSLKSFQEVVRTNEVRFKTGDIGMLELRQSRVEADRFAVDVTSAEGDARAAEVNLSALLGKRFDEVFPNSIVDSELKREPLKVNLEDLIKQAQENRDDIRVAMVAVQNSDDSLRLAHANRWVDPTVNVGLINTPRVAPIYDSGGAETNYPANRSLALGLTLTIPIPFSRLQRGELTQAETALKQAHLQLSSTRVKAETEVRATYIQYRAATRNVQSYVEHVLKDADHVLDWMRKSYRMGAASLLELLNAQRTADDVYIGYLQTLADLANATVKLQMSVGMRPDL
jgi:cobalt-zinc-cadmium efflux system outer membrane protein